MDKGQIAHAVIDAAAFATIVAYFSKRTSELEEQIKQLQDDVKVVAKTQNGVAGRHATAINSINQAVGGINNELRRILSTQHRPEVSSASKFADNVPRQQERRVRIQEEESYDSLDDDYDSSEELTPPPRRKKSAGSAPRGEVTLKPAPRPKIEANDMDDLRAMAKRMQAAAEADE